MLIVIVFWQQILFKYIARSCPRWKFYEMDNENLEGHRAIFKVKQYIW